MSKPIATKSLKMIEYFKDNPLAKPRAVAAKFKTAVSTAYKIRDRARQKSWQPPELLPMPEVTDSETTTVLKQRGQRYGLFSEQARIAQSLKNALRAEKGFYRLSEVQKEALEMVMHKIARMLNGDPTYDDNVVDIMGYTELMLRHMRGKEHEL